MTRTPDLLAAALAAAARGWPVFPLRPNDKRPAFPDHTAARCTGRDPRCTAGHQGWEPRATTDPDRIRRAWSRAPFNVGIACGPAGLLVIDLDQPKPGNNTPPAEWNADGIHTGEDVLALAAEQAGAVLEPLYDTYTVVTGRGGRHLYFTQPTGVRLVNSESRLGWLIDTRGHGGYVVAAGSTVAGRPYTLAYDTTPAPLPAWPLQQLVTTSTPQRAPIPVPVPESRRNPYLDAVLTRETDRLRATAPGTRRKQLYLTAINLGRLAAGGALAADVVENLLKGCAAEHIAVGAYTRAQADSAITSGLAVGAQRPRTVAA